MNRNVLSKRKLAITLTMLLSITLARNISPAHAEIGSLIGTTIAMKKNSDTLLNSSFDMSIFSEDPAIQAVGMIFDICSQGIDALTEEVRNVEGIAALSRLTGIPDSYWENLDKLSQPFVRNLTTQVACALWFGYCGPTLFIANVAIYTTAQVLSIFTILPGVEMFNLYRVYLQYSMFGLLPAGRAFVFTIINQLTDWASPVQNPTSIWGKIKNFTAKNRAKIKLTLFAANTLYWGVSKLFSWFNFSATTDEIDSCSGAIDSFNKAITMNKNGPNIEKLPLNATDHMVKKAYRGLAKAFHPDVQHHLAEHQKVPNAKSIWLKIVEAKDFFMNKCKK